MPQADSSAYSGHDSTTLYIEPRSPRRLCISAKFFAAQDESRFERLRPDVRRRARRAHFAHQCQVRTKRFDVRCESRGQRALTQPLRERTGRRGGICPRPSRTGSAASPSIRVHRSATSQDRRASRRRQPSNPRVVLRPRRRRNTVSRADCPAARSARRVAQPAARRVPAAHGDCSGAGCSAKNSRNIALP